MKWKLHGMEDSFKVLIRSLITMRSRLARPIWGIGQSMGGFPVNGGRCTGPVYRKRYWCALIVHSGTLQAKIDTRHLRLLFQHMHLTVIDFLPALSITYRRKNQEEMVGCGCQDEKVPLCRFRSHRQDFELPCLFGWLPGNFTRFHVLFYSAFKGWIHKVMC